VRAKKCVKTRKVGKAMLSILGYSVNKVAGALSGISNPFVGGVEVRFLSSFSHRFFTLSSRPGARLMNEQPRR
jgi:hypothetical protein